jgi:hypothetical protein
MVALRLYVFETRRNVPQAPQSLQRDVGAIGEGDGDGGFAGGAGVEFCGGIRSTPGCVT